MDKFRLTKTYRQLNLGSAKDVFSLLCPVRECEWLDGWNYTMLYSVSGKIEKDCIFSTSGIHNKESLWTVSKYDSEKLIIEFLRFTPHSTFVKINLQVKEIDEKSCYTLISYNYTALSKESRVHLEKNLSRDFEEMMIWWEQSMNHFLTTGKKLLKEVQ